MSRLERFGVAALRAIACAFATLTLLGAIAAPVFAQAPLLEEVRTIGEGIAPPVERAFEVTLAGDHRIDLTDLATDPSCTQDPACPARPLASIRLAITRGATLVATLDAAGSRTIDLPAGAYAARVVGTPDVTARTGDFRVVVTSNASGGGVLLQFTATLTLPPPAVPSNQARIDTTFDVGEAGTFEAVLRDLAFPAALSRTDVIVIAPDGLPIARFRPTDTDAGDAVRTRTFSTVAGVHQLFALGESPAATNAGLFSLNVRAAASSAVPFSRTIPVGQVVLLGSVSLGGAPSTLALTDFEFPVALDQRRALIAREGQEVARTATNGDLTFTSSGSHQVFALGTVTAPEASGVYGLQIGPQGAAPAFSAVQPVGAGGTRTFVFPVDVVAAGSYRARLVDFQFPSGIVRSTAGLAATRGATLLGRMLGTPQQPLATPATLDLDGLAAGRIHLLVNVEAAPPPPGIPAGALVGIELAPAGGGAPVFEATQGVGALFSARKISILDTDSYRASVTDVGFPASFVELAAVVTRGTERLGSIFGGGTFDFAATPGNYFVNFVARPNTSGPAGAERAGTYGITIGRKPPAPTVTLTADPVRVSSGGTVTLTWSSTNATGCTASGGWSGARAASGRETTSAITVSTTFSLSCAGPGGSASQSVTIDIAAPQSGGGGGGGSLHRLTLLMLAFALGASGIARRSRARVD
jgi:hypothetical protein